MSAKREYKDDVSNSEDSEDSEEESDEEYDELEDSNYQILNLLKELLKVSSKQVITSSQSFDTFVSFVKLYCNIDTEDNTKKLLFNASCESSHDVAMFMLTNSKCNENILTSIVDNYCPLLRSFSVKNEVLSIEILKNIPNLNECLKQKISETPLLFYINNVSVLEYVLEHPTVTSSLLMETNSYGKNYFDYAVGSIWSTNILKCLLKSDKCTDEVMSHVTKKGRTALSHCFAENQKNFIMLIESNKLTIDDFYHKDNSKCEPLYYSILKSSKEKIVSAYMNSQYCTIDCIEQFLDSTKWKTTNNLIRKIFAHEKFKCLKEKYDFSNKNLVKKQVIVQSDVKADLNPLKIEMEIEMEILKMEIEKLRAERALLILVNK